MKGPQRYSTVPWLVTSMDLEPHGDPETTVELGNGAEITHGLRIARPFGVDTDAMLAIHAIRSSGEITLAITAILTLDHRPTRTWQPYMGPTQSGSSRAKRVWPLPDDNGANDPDEG